MKVKTERQPRLRAANLNLIPILRALLRECSVTRAAASLGLSPSAVSCALAELRLLLDDPLLVPTGRAMRMTPRAEQLIGKLEQACVALENLLETESFDAASAQRNFIVAAPDYLGMLIGGQLMQDLRQHAPGMRVRFVDVAGDLERQLEQGKVDLGIVAINRLEWKGITGGPDCRDRQVGLVDAAHELAGAVSLTEAAIAPYPKLDWTPWLSLSERVDAAHAEGSPYWNQAAITVQWYCTLPMMVLGTDHIGIVPASLARHMCRILPLHMFELPEGALENRVSPLWSRLQHTDPAHAWFRKRVQRAMTAVLS